MFPGRALHLTSGIPNKVRLQCRSSADGKRSTSTSTGGRNPMAKAALTSGALSLLGDVLAQLLTQKTKVGRIDARKLDKRRMARMASFGFLFYGPYQYKWYAALDCRWPSAGWRNFLTKVTLNQIALSPVVLAVVFSWNLVLTHQSDQISRKIKSDLVPTMLNGWKFWVPAASINFAVVPLQHQVLYMSFCSVLWTGYLSFQSNK